MIETKKVREMKKNATNICHQALWALHPYIANIFATQAFHQRLCVFITEVKNCFQTLTIFNLGDLLNIMCS